MFIKMYEKNITMAGLWWVFQVCSTPLCMALCTHLITAGGTPHLAFSYKCYVTSPTVYRFPWFKHSNWLLFHEQYIGVNGKMFWWLMKKKKFDWELVESGLIFCRDLYQHKRMCVCVCVCVCVGGGGGGGGGVQMPTLTEENSQFLQSGSQEVQCNAVPTWVCVYTDWALSGTKKLTQIYLQERKLTVDCENMHFISFGKPKNRTWFYLVGTCKIRPPKSRGLRKA